MRSTSLSTVALLAGLAAPVRAAEPTAVELWVVLVDTTNLPEPALECLENEVEAIYAGADVRIRWLDEFVSERGPHIARVYVMNELPRSIDARIRPFTGDAMGLALGRAGEASGPVIYASRVAVVRSVTGVSEAVLSPEVTGRALGRIVAHELAHRYLQRQHTHRGILAGNLGRSELVDSGREFFFTPKQRERLHRIGVLGADSDHPDQEPSRR